MGEKAQMQITGAKYDNGNLILQVPIKDASIFLNSFKQGNYNFKRQERKRSLDANAYCWVLIGMISEKINDSPQEIYKRYVRDVGSMMRVSCVQIKDVEAECEEFMDGHIGRLVEIGESKIDGCATIKKFYGSSNYNVKQMARFIDVIVQDCNELGIETRSEEDIKSLLEEWK